MQNKYVSYLKGRRMLPLLTAAVDDELILFAALDVQYESCWSVAAVEDTTGLIIICSLRRHMNRLLAGEANSQTIEQLLMA